MAKKMPLPLCFQNPPFTHTLLEVATMLKRGSPYTLLFIFFLMIALGAIPRVEAASSTESLAFSASDGNAAACLHANGNLFLRGALHSGMSGISATSNNDNWVVFNNASQAVALLEKSHNGASPFGDLTIAGSVYAQQATSAIPTDAPWLARDAQGNALAAIDAAGNLYLRGVLVENVSDPRERAEGGVLNFLNTQVVYERNIPSAIIAVKRTGSTEKSVSIDYATSNGTAAAGDWHNYPNTDGNYISTNGTLTFAAGDSVQTFQVLLVNNAVGETTKTVNLALSSPSNSAALGTRHHSVLAIVDAPTTGSVPANPTSVATALTSSTTFSSATEFLYTGTDAVQTGVTSGSLESERACVLRGRVLCENDDATTQALAGVKIQILNHPEWGSTLSRTDGAYDMVVSGGGVLNITCEKTGYLNMQRQVVLPWNNYIIAPDICMTPIDRVETFIDLNTTSSVQIAQNCTADSNGERYASLLFFPGTTATMVFADATTQTIKSFHARITEYTVGDNGTKKMPAGLPPASAYTYCAEYSLDEATAQGALNIHFTNSDANQAPIVALVDNFLGFPVGSPVPSGYYDKLKATWIPEKDGRVIQCLGMDEEGRAVLAVDAQDTTSTAERLAELGIYDAERIQLAPLYAAGEVFWRTPVSHFSIWDLNWPEIWAKIVKPSSPVCLCSCPCPEGPDTHGVIAYGNQSFSEKVQVPGTPYTLKYTSRYAPAYDPMVRIPLINADQDVSDMKRVELTLEFAGRTLKKTFAPSPGLFYDFKFDGLDAFGR
ncbi:TPA: hypothetical protein DDW35_03210, partial [Candidatus Sumerlaeota bacterium]|nr:hypothetical protein [Candidatus Sumerlaeota bacterium]